MSPEEHARQDVANAAAEVFPLDKLIKVLDVITEWHRNGGILVELAVRLHEEIGARGGYHAVERFVDQQHGNIRAWLGSCELVRASE